MWFAYIDESFNDAQHWIGAVLVQHTHVNEAQRAIRTVVAEAAGTYGITADTELHGHRIFHGEGDFAPMKQLVRARVGIYASVFDCLVDAGCWIVLRGVSKPHLVNRYAYPEHPHRVSMTHLIERVDEFASGRGDHALLIADEHHETQSTLLRDLIARIRSTARGAIGDIASGRSWTRSTSFGPRLTGSFRVPTWSRSSRSAGRRTRRRTPVHGRQTTVFGESSNRESSISGAGTPRRTKGPTRWDPKAGRAAEARPYVHHSTTVGRNRPAP